MDSRTPQRRLIKRLAEDFKSGRLRKRSYSVLDTEDDESIAEKLFIFRVLLPNGTTVHLKTRVPGGEMSLQEFVGLVKEEYLSVVMRSGTFKSGRIIDWSNQDLHFVDANEKQIRKTLNFKNFRPNSSHILRLQDGTAEPGEYENMWDLTPDTDLLFELPEHYNLEAALADLIDNSLQAVWSNGTNERRLISVDIAENRIEIFDTGPGMDGSDENSIVKWGKIGASLHRLAREQGIESKPPYLTPFFGMFGYGGPFATMHLGRHALVSSKTKQSKKVYMLCLEREALLSSSSEQTWRTNGGLRDPEKNELEKAPHGSFTKVEIFEPKMRSMNIALLRGRLKDIYFPYIQCDELSRTGKTEMPIEFQVNGIDLAEIFSGEVAVTNVNSCIGADFTLQLLFTKKVNCTTSSSDHGYRASQVAHARFKCVYFPITQGKESIDRILEKLEADGCGITENYKSFSRVSIRRLGRLLPDARWAWLPFMEPKQRKGDRAQILKRCSNRVKCFIDTDAGFNPTPSKTDLAHQNPYTIALKSFGKKHIEDEKDVHIEIHKDGIILNLSKLEKLYEDWIISMHNQYDEEIDSGKDEPTFVVNPSNKKELGISSDVVRVHKIFRRKEATWRSGQKIKILKGACAGHHKTNTYATLQFIILEGWEGDTGGEARLICRPIDIPDDIGCSLVCDNGNAHIKMGSSISLPISVIDSEKCVAIDDAVWDNQLQKRSLKVPSSINVLSAKDCHELGSGGKGLRSITFEKGVQVQSEMGSWRLLNDKQNAKFIARVGSCFPPFSIACFDKYNNRTPFPFDTKVMVKLSSCKGFIAHTCNMKQDISSDKFTAIIKDVKVESTELDKIRPNYNATLTVWSQNESFSVDIPCQVLPGAPKSVLVRPLNLTKQLLPGQIIDDLVLEMFDAYGNHVKENENVHLQLHGFCVQDERGLPFKADQSGSVDLSGFLKVVEGYGKHVAFSVGSSNQMIFKEEFQIEIRKLRPAFEVPILCAAGSELEQLVFEVVNMHGEVDELIHNEEENGQFHTLRIMSDSLDIDNSVEYSFSFGRCMVRAIPVPQKEGTFCFKATHSRHPEIHLNVEVHLVQHLNTKHENALSQNLESQIFLSQESSELEAYGNHPHHSAERRISLLPDSSACSDVGNFVRCEMNDHEELEGKLCQYGLCIKWHETNITSLNLQQSKIKQDLSNLRASLDLDDIHDLDGISGKEYIMELIVCKGDSAAAVICRLFQSLTYKEKAEDFVDRILGVVAFLGTVQTNGLSRIFAQYLGEHQMLAIVCKSYAEAAYFEKYEPDGRVNSAYGLHAVAAELGISINKQYHVLCVENIRPYSGNFCSDPQRNLDLPIPSLPNGKPPPGFLGYAVNMIELDVNFRQWRTASGHGLRETLFYRLFGELQVYENREYMSRASSCIKDTAVSLDGGIMRGNGVISLGYWESDIQFPVVPLESQRYFSPRRVEVAKEIKTKKQELRETADQLKIEERTYAKLMKKYRKTKDGYNSLLDEQEESLGSLACKLERDDLNKSAC